jgi:diphosphomevalonate decarboxylase
MPTATALAHPNIAFIKYWGNIDHDLRLPANGSLSMNLEGLFTQTEVTFTPDISSDELVLNRQQITGPGLERVSRLLDRVRQLAKLDDFARVTSENNFPTGVGVASSASAFAALSLAASHAAGLELDERQLSRLARTGSGSACRSIPGGFVEWQAGHLEADSYAFSIAPAEHWDLVDCIAVVTTEHKPTGSTQGHFLAATSPLQPARVLDTPRRLEICRTAILEQDFETFAAITELDSNMMHAVMLTSTPPLIYWQPATLAIMRSVQSLRSQNFPVCYTIDAGPNVHVITRVEYAGQLTETLTNIPGVEKVLTAPTGGPAHLVEHGF